MKFYKRATLYTVASILIMYGVALITAADAGASPAGSGSCTVAFSGALTSVPPYDPSADISGSVSCSGLGSMGSTNGVVIGINPPGTGAQLWWFISGNYSNMVPTSFSCAQTAGPTTTGFCTTYGGGADWTSLNGNGWHGMCTYAGNVICGEGNAGETWHGGVGLTWTSTVVGYTGSGFAPCTLQHLSGPSVFDQGTSYAVAATWQGTAESIVYDLNVDPSFGGGVAAPYNYQAGYTAHGKTFSFPFVYDQSPHSPLSFAIDLEHASPAVFGGGGSSYNLEAWCYSSGSGWVDWGDVSTIVQPSTGIGTPSGSGVIAVNSSGQGGAFDFAACTASSGISFNPASWVPALVNWGVCGIRWLFEPSSDTWHSLADQFSISSNNPTIGGDSASQWLGAVGYMLTVGPAAGAGAIQSCVSAGCTSSVLSAGMTVGPSGHTETVGIGGAITAVAAGSPSWVVILVDLLATFLVVLFFIEIIKWIRKVLGSTE